MEEKYLSAKEKLIKSRQENLLNYLDKSEKKEELINQILKIDFEQIMNLYEQTKNKIDFSKDVIEPIDYIDKYNISSEKLEEYKKIGEEKIKNGKYAVVTMAGGQGTRLGHNGPKGTFNIGLKSNKSIFEILIDSLKESSKKYETTINWYIMTSKENNKDTKAFFEKNDFFGYPKESVMFFIQGELPMCDEQGQVIIGENGLIKEAADGHGGIFESLRSNLIINDMEKKGIEWAFIGPVDNVLVKMVDEILLGATIKNGMQAGGKSVVKAGPKEKVGVFCRRNGKPGVVEYTEISDEMSERLNDNGELVFAESHINCNLFSVKAIKEISNKKLPYHSAYKKSKFINLEGELVTPDKPNAYKFESFIFDAFDMLEDMTILRVKREEEFAPVKNAEGSDSPETARKLYMNYNAIV
ncbi:MAG TPA: UTP--glucose-1-phosphate uridylyltransferase [Clostridia bacterium]|nr:UTP--glucose-1-phosphate uridylyltransferase [Clostridia bacterium]